MQFDPDLPWRDVRGSGFAATVGPFRFARAGASEWHAALAVEARHLNLGGVCHGGALLTLADIAMGTGSYEAGGGRPCVTIDLDAHFLAPVREGQRALARVRQERGVRDLSFMSVEIWAGDRLALRGGGIWKYRTGRAGAAPAAGAP